MAASANYIRRNPTKVWRDAGGDFTATFTALPAGSSRVGPVWDRGAFPIPFLLRWALETQWAGAPTAQRSLNLFLALWDDDTTGTPGSPAGGIGVGDGALPNAIARFNLSFAGRVICESTTPNLCRSVGTIECPYRYVSPVIYNDNTTALAASGVVPTIVRLSEIFNEGQ